MAKPKSKPRKHRDYTIVPGPDGKYYLVGIHHETVLALPDDDEHWKGLAELLEKQDDELTTYICEHQGNMTAGSGVHNGAPDIFPNPN